MAYIHPDVLDNGLSELTGATALHILSGAADPADRAAALVVSLGNKAAPGVSAPSERVAGGREVVVSEVTDGAVTATDTATRWALIDGTRLLAVNTLSTPQSVTDGNLFSLTSFTIGIPNPA